MPIGNVLFYYELVLGIESACIAYAGTRGCLVSGWAALTCLIEGVVGEGKGMCWWVLCYGE
jgi:hypothetical protein